MFLTDKWHDSIIDAPGHGQQQQLHEPREHFQNYKMKQTVDIVPCRRAGGKTSRKEAGRGSQSLTLMSKSSGADSGLTVSEETTAPDSFPDLVICCVTA